MQGDSRKAAQETAPDLPGRLRERAGTEHLERGRGGTRARLARHVDDSDRLLQDWLPNREGVSALQGWLTSHRVQALHGVDPGRHEVRIVPSHWAVVVGPHWPEEIGASDTRTALSRQDLFDLAARADGSWIPLLATTYAWGQGTFGYGPARLRKILESNDHNEMDRSLADAVNALRSDGPATGYRVLNRRVRHLGPAFFTKFLYAAGEGLALDRPRPLILDQRVAASLRTLTTTLNRQDGLPPDLSAWLWTHNGWSPHRYEQYVSFAHRLSTHLHRTIDGWPDRPDLIELALFDKGLRDRLWGADT
jgi:hypothetical protein